MSAPTPADQAAAAVIVAEWTVGSRQTSDLREAIAQAMAKERAAARGGLPDNPDVGKVAFRIEAWPHDPGANGEEYVSGHMHAGDVAGWLREIADRCERYWGDPECPWDGQPGHTPKRPEVDRQREEEARAAKLAYIAQIEAEAGQ